MYTTPSSTMDIWDKNKAMVHVKGATFPFPTALVKYLTESEAKRLRAGTGGKYPFIISRRMPKVM